MIKKAKKTVLHAYHRLSVSGLLGIAVLFIVASLVAGSVQAIQENFQRQLQVDRLAQEVALLELEVKTLELQNQYYQTDEYLELQARELMGLARPGEKVVMLPNTGSETSKAATSPGPSLEVPLEKRSNLKQWLYFLFSDKQVNTESP